MKCEICKQPILEEGYKYVHPICPKGEDAETHRPKRIRITAPGSGFNIGTEWDVHSVEPPYYKISEDEAVPFSQCELIDIHDLEPELTPEEKEWFEGLEYVRPDGPFPFFRFCPCGSISQHLPIAREQITPIQWIREHYEHRNMKDKVEKEIKYCPDCGEETLTQDLDGNPVGCGAKPKLTDEHWTAKLFPDFAQLSGDAIANPILSALFFVTDGAVFMRVERDPQDLLLKSPYRWMLHEGGAKVLQARPFEEYQSDIAQWVESLGGEKPATRRELAHVFHKSPPAWRICTKSGAGTVSEVVVHDLEEFFGKEIPIYEPATYTAEWTDLTHVYCAYASCGVVESQPKDYSVFRLEVKRV